MADEDSIVNNPFAALFPSLVQAQQFSVSSKQAQHDQQPVVLTHAVGEEPENDREQNIKDLVKKKLAINSLIENIFLITLDDDPSGDNRRPPRCVYLSGMAEYMDEQTWLDLDCLEQAVFERLLMKVPGSHVIATRGSEKSLKEATSAGEALVLRYLYDCYDRYMNVVSGTQFAEYEGELQRCKAVILMNSRTCLQQSDLYPDQQLHRQFIDIYLDHNDYFSDGGYVKTYFSEVSMEIESNKTDGTLQQVFHPALDIVKTRFHEDFSIMHPEVPRYIDLLTFFTQNQPLAQVFMEYNAPADWKNGKDYEKSLLGSILGLSCIASLEAGKPPEFFNNPTSSTQQDINIMEKSIWTPLSGICERVGQLMLALIKVSTDTRHQVMSWLGKCLQANSGRAKIWSTHAPQVFHQMYCSDGFILNLGHVMLKLCQPFSTACSPKLLRVQPSYVRVVVPSDADARQKSVHAEGLSKETCLIPSEGNANLQEETSYNFITECFFLCHQTINQGFHAVHSKLLKVNQELQRIQRAYGDMRSQYPNDDVEPVRSFKQQMEKGMTLYLSMKAALTEPTLLEMCMQFHTATASWLAQVAVADDVTTFQPIVLPLPSHVPPSLAYVPEFIMGNVTDYTMFLHRFKDSMYETGGAGLENFMSLILVYMGSPGRMRNPHLRAELAETLAALMPRNPNMTQSQQGVSKYYREQLFEHHPLIEHLAEKLLHVFVSIEMTGQSVEFEQKFNYRRPMYHVLDFIWEKELHRTAIKKLSEHAEVNIEDTDAPLFLRFINLLINDAIFLLDEALDYMKQIKEKQREKTGPEREALTPRQQQEFDNNLRHLGMIARYHNMMGNNTIHALEMITREIKTIFCHSMMVDRIAGMLNYFLLHLVGPRRRDFKVKDKDELEFKPEQIVSDITQIYLNLSESEDFCKAVAGDGRSYSDALFPKAMEVLEMIHKSPMMISSFQELHVKISAIGQAQQEEEELLADAPEDFLDPIMGTLMRDPVTLPTSGNIVDRAIISRHILSDQMDPFNRQPLTLDMVVPNTELRARIDAWINEQREAHS